MRHGHRQIDGVREQIHMRLQDVSRKSAGVRVKDFDVLRLQAEPCPQT